MLRHSYTLMGAGDTPNIGLLPHQLRELCVMAGLDPAAAATRALVEELVRRKDTHTVSGQPSGCYSRCCRPSQRQAYTSNYLACMFDILTQPKIHVEAGDHIKLGRHVCTRTCLKCTIPAYCRMACTSKVCRSWQKGRLCAATC